MFACDTDKQQDRALYPSRLLSERRMPIATGARWLRCFGACATSGLMTSDRAMFTGRARPNADLRSILFDRAGTRSARDFCCGLNYRTHSNRMAV